MGRTACRDRLAGQPRRGVAARDAAGAGADKPVRPVSTFAACRRGNPPKRPAAAQDANRTRFAPPGGLSDGPGIALKAFPLRRTSSAPGSRVTVPGAEPTLPGTIY